MFSAPFTSGFAVLLLLLAEPATRNVPGDAPTIQGAIEASRPGDVVRVAAGEYEEALTFRGGITLEAQEGATVVIRQPATAGPVLSISGCDGGTVRGIVFEHTGVPEDAEQNPDAEPVVKVLDSTVEIANCEVRGSAASGILIKGKSTVAVRDCRAHGNTRNGVAVDGPDAQLAITGCTLTRNKSVGLSFSGGTAGTAEGNNCVENVWYGIMVVGEGTAPTLQSNTCSKNGDNGLYFGPGTGGVAVDNTCADNGNHGISIDGAGAKPRLERNVCRGNKRFGIWFGSSEVYARNNTYTHNGEVSKEEIRRLWRLKEYDDLDVIAARLLAEKARYPSTQWQLHWFYEYLVSGCSTMGPTEESEFLAGLDAWQQQHPKSTTPLVLRARAYDQFGWRERSGGWAHEVTTKGWEGFRTYLRKAWDLIAEIEKRGCKDPELYYAKAVVANGLGSEVAPAQSLVGAVVQLLGGAAPADPVELAFQQGVKLEPLYTALYEARTWSLLPRWRGSAEEIVAFADRSAKATAAQEGEAMYARIASHVLAVETPEDFKQYRFSWQRIDQGYRDMYERYGTAYILNAHCQMACAFAKREVARDLFERIGDQWGVDLWQSEHHYAVWYKWASGEGDYPRGKPLEKAVLAGDARRVAALLREGADPNDSNEYGDPMLLLAVRKEQTDVARALIDGGADVNRPGVEGKTPLHVAVGDENSTDLLRLLLERGADPDAHSAEGWTPLLNATSWGYADQALVLLEHGADPNKTPSGWKSTALHYAIAKDMTEVVRALLERGADPNARDGNGYTTLVAAAHAGNVELCQTLIDKGADVNLSSDTGWNALFTAVDNGNLAVTRFLISKGARVDAVQNDGWSLFHMAAANGNVPMLEFLLEQLPEGLEYKTHAKRTLLHQAAKSGHLELTRYLVDKGLDIHAKDDKNRTPLAFAEEGGHTEVANLLRGRGAKV
jgi:ankyrin repeat protein